MTTLKSAFSAYRDAGLIQPKKKKVKNVTQNNWKAQQKAPVKKAVTNGGIKKIHAPKLSKAAKKNLKKTAQQTLIKSKPAVENKVNVESKPVVLNSEPPMVVIEEAVAASHKQSLILPPVVANSSFNNGELMFKWVISPTNLDNFYAKNWEKKHLLIKRQDPKYFSTLLSVHKIDKMLRQNRIEFTKNIDITSYDDGVRSTHNPEGRALPAVVWDYYRNGCSIRLLNPQTFIPQIHNLTATLQEYFQCMTGTNVYLTPPNSQGFAPHYDDIEAFVIQIEGKKRWKLYKPRTPNEVLPRFSSQNFTQEEIGQPILDVLLEPGDVLYFPRGVIHQACTVPNHHSLHLTLSVYQKNSWGDLMESLVSTALSNAINNDVAFREGLPINLGQFMGLAFSNRKSDVRTRAIEKVKSLFDKLFDYAPLDDAVDAMHKKFHHDAMPPDLSAAELERTVFGAKPQFAEDGSVSIDNNISLGTRVRLLRGNILRLVKEQGKMLIYYSSENSKEYHEFEPQSLEIECDDAILITTLIRKYPQFLSVQQLPLSEDADSEDKRLNIVQDLWEKGLLMTQDSLT